MIKNELVEIYLHEYTQRIAECKSIYIPVHLKHITWANLVNTSAAHPTAHTTTTAELLAESDMECHDVLVRVDPRTANKLHANDKRKIRRALEVYSKTGVAYSVWIDQQKSAGCVGYDTITPHSFLMFLTDSVPFFQSQELQG